MKYSVLGPTGMRVSRICLGTATFGVAPSPQDADGVVGAALDLGVNFFDTANVYGSTPTFDRPGSPPAAARESAEKILGRALAGRRDEVVLATKSGERRFDPEAGLSRRYIIQQVEQSLRRLGTDYIDVYCAHFPDPDTPLEQTLAVYDDLIRQGKLRHIALSNHPAWQVTEALWIADDRRLVSAPVCAQVKSTPAPGIGWPRNPGRRHPLLYLRPAWQARHLDLAEAVDEVNRLARCLLHQGQGRPGLEGGTRCRQQRRAAAGALESSAILGD